MSAFVSFSWAPASWARVCWKLWSLVRRMLTLIAFAVTPRDVAPPLDPEKAMHGGEYGSPGTCHFWPAHAAVWPGWTRPLPAVPARPAVAWLPADPPEEATDPEWLDAAAAPAAVPPAGAVGADDLEASVLPDGPAARPLEPLLLPDDAVLLLFGTLLGTAMARTASNATRATAGP